MERRVEMLEFVFLAEEFFQDYSGCPEIERKTNRPYIRIEIEVDGILWAIPMRSNINHPNVLWTDKKNRCGVDFSKAVVVADSMRYINRDMKPHIRQNEFDALRGKEFQVKEGLRKYIAKYKKAKREPKIPRNKILLECSTLQYFEEYI